MNMNTKPNRVAFEQALDMTGYARYNLCMFILCASIILGMTFEIFSVSYLVPASVCELHTTNVQQGLVACVPLAGIIATSHIWGYLADTKGRRKILIISMTLSYISGTCAAFSPNWIVLSFLKFISSASVSGAFALSVTLLSECTPMRRRSVLVILSTSVFLTGTGVMAVLSIPILPLSFSYYIPVLDIYFNSWRLLDLIFAMPCAISALGAVFAYESPKYLLSVGRNKEALEVLRGMYVMNYGKSGDSYEVDELILDEDSKSTGHKGFFASMVAQTMPMLRPPLLKHTVLLSCLYVISYMSSNSFTVWLPFIVNAFMTSVMEGNSHLTVCEMIRIYQNSTTVVESTDCSMNSFAMTMVFGINFILAIMNIGMSGLVNKLGRKNLFIGVQVVAGVSALCINSSPFWMLSAVLFMCFMSGVFNFGFLSTFSVDIFPTYVKAMAVCLTLMVGRGSAIFGINILKRLLDNNCEYAFYIFGSVTCFGGIVGLLLPSDAKIRDHKKALKS
ncbi:putative transporter svop-1 [Anticarsia gemmatalis]|uniref:putative transporter svop-1 n=1 Tax=Anticarsia gemmatalis TaxID=129554 RepID=UPI003F75B6F0